MTQSLNSAPQKQKFSVAINSKMYQNLIASTLRDPARARRFTAAITSAVAVNPALQECDAGTILAGALLGESLNLSPSPQLGQYYLVPFKQKAKYDRGGNMIRPETTTATFVLGYKGYIQLALRSGQYKDLDVMVIKQGEYMGKDPETGKAKFQFIEDDDERETLPTIGYMAYFEYLNGFRNLYRENDPDEMSDAWAVSLTDVTYDAAISDALFTKLKNLFRNLHDTWLQYFHRTVIQKKLLNANVPDIPEDADGFGDIDPDDLNADGLVDTTPPEDTDEEE